MFPYGMSQLYQRNAAIMMKMFRKYITWAATILSSKNGRSSEFKKEKVAT
jgi:hypothetical protein